MVAGKGLFGSTLQYLILLGLYETDNIETDAPS
jgi:hypothetical protein